MGYAIKDGHFRVDSRLVGHWLWREIQIQIPGLDDSNDLYQGGYFFCTSYLIFETESEIIRYKVRSAQK